MSTTDATAKLIYTAKVHTTGGRDGGSAYSDDNRLNIRLSLPGTRGVGTNPEQLLAAGWSACFEGAIGIAARQRRTALPPSVAIDAEIDLCADGAAYFLRARLNVLLPGLPHDDAAALIESAHRLCPYSKALQGNIDIVINLVDAGRVTAIVESGSSAQRAA